MSRMKTKEEFIKDARAVHGDKYNYDKVVYTGNKNKVIITCKIHGDFEQKPNSHLSSGSSKTGGSGCRPCGYAKNGDEMKSTKEKFEAKARLIHGDKYNYDKVVYDGNKTHVIIFCKDHGDFHQRPNDHLTGYGCKKCGIESCHAVLKRTTNQFIKEAIAIHGDKYDYSKVEYLRNDYPVTIVCKKHGEFDQRSVSHLNLKANCPTCSGNFKDTRTFIIDVKAKYGEKRFKFDQTRYVNARKFVTIFDTVSNKSLSLDPMKILRQTMCQRCENYATHGQSEPTHCTKHKMPQQTRLVNSAVDQDCRTEGCNCNGTVTFDGYCFVCFYKDQKLTRFRDKEYQTMAFLTKRFSEQKLLLNVSVGERRPDVLIKLDDRAIIVEIDEHQHVSYDKATEKERQIYIQQELEMPVVFIRFNPDKQVRKGINIPSCWEKTSDCYVVDDEDAWNSRLELLAGWVDHYIDNPPEEELTCKKLYYDRI